MSTQQPGNVVRYDFRQGSLGTGPVRKPVQPPADLDTLRLGQMLHTALEPERLVSLFANELTHHVPHDGLRFISHEPALELVQGGDARHHLSYRLTLAGEDLGELTLLRNRPFRSHEAEVTERLLCALVYPLRNARMYQRALDMAQRDALTGLLNRGAFQQALEREMHLALRQGGTQTALLMVDADHFKRVNDEHGHLAGDQVLKALARIMGERVRRSDQLFRFGGEEFALILSATDLEGARALAEDLRAAVAESLLDADGQALAVTVSVGCTALRPEDTGDNALRRADAALYMAKERGRNQVAAVA